MIKKIWANLWLRFFFITLFIAIVLFLCRGPILRGVADWLVADDKLQPTDAIFVLGGNSYERGMEAAKMYEVFPQTPLITSGGNIPDQLEALGLVMTEADLTKELLKQRQVPDSCIVSMGKGTSTKEESDFIVDYCQQHSYKKVMIISNDFHLRRVRWTFGANMEKAGIELVLHGAPHRAFSRYNWWNTEEGLVAVNNEMIKLVYYFFKY